MEFDYSLVASDKELEDMKRLSLNLSGLGRKFANKVDELAERKRRHLKNNLQKESVLT